MKALATNLCTQESTKSLFLIPSNKEGLNSLMKDYQQDEETQMYFLNQGLTKAKVKRLLSRTSMTVRTSLKKGVKPPLKNLKDLKSLFLITAQNLLNADNRTKEENKQKRLFVVYDESPTIELTEEKSPEDKMCEEETFLFVEKILQKHMAKLSPVHQEILKLRFFAQLSYKEIARVLNDMKCSTCRSVVSKALQSFKKEVRTRVN